MDTHASTFLFDTGSQNQLFVALFNEIPWTLLEQTWFEQVFNLTWPWSWNEVHERKEGDLAVEFWSCVWTQSAAGQVALSVCLSVCLSVPPSLPPWSLAVWLVLLLPIMTMCTKTIRHKHSGFPQPVKGVLSTSCAWCAWNGPFVLARNRRTSFTFTPTVTMTRHRPESVWYIYL